MGQPIMFSDTATIDERLDLENLSNYDARQAINDVKALCELKLISSSERDSYIRRLEHYISTH